MAIQASEKTSGNKKSTTTSKTNKPNPRGGRSKRAGKNRQAATAPKQTQTKSRTFPIIKVSTDIDHGITRKAFDQHVDGFRGAFFYTTSILGSFGLPEGAERAHAYIIELIDNAKREVETETARISKMVEAEAGTKSIPRTSPEKTSRETEVPSFVVRKYLSLFPVVDRLIDAIVCAESHGAISWTRRDELLKLAKHYLRSPAGRFHSLSQKLVARQRLHGKNMAAAREAMLEVLNATIEEHKAIPGIEKKHPMTGKKTGTAG